MTSSALKQDPKTKRFKWMLIYFKHTQSMQIFGEIPFIKPQNDTTNKWSETMKNERKRLTLFWFSFYSLFSVWKNFKYIIKLLTCTKSTVHHKKIFFKLFQSIPFFVCLYFPLVCFETCFVVWTGQKCGRLIQARQQPDCITTNIIGDIIRNKK